MLPVKNLMLKHPDGTETVGFGYDATLKEVDVGKIRAYLSEDSVVIEEITPRSFREMTFADGLLRIVLDVAAEKNILYYRFADHILSELPVELFEMGYKREGDYIYRFFTQNKHCNGDCSNCAQR